MARVTQNRTSPDMCELLVRRSLPTLKWMTTKGVRFAPIYGRQAFKVDGKFKFWGGLTVESVGGGPGLVEALHKAAVREGITVMYETRALSLLADDKGVHGLRVKQKGVTKDIRAKAVILAPGGLQPNPQARTRYLRPPRDLAKRRASRCHLRAGTPTAQY